ncbi:ExbD/TolR family protein [Pseudooceanicola sp. C21-150M6]|uniref:ExbD/TolR family protein n=1 Tax=Pseudooceanicola sp. C21-150M6 TaxID=3434355 RepID=UPI003D7F3CF7
MKLKRRTPQMTGEPIIALIDVVFFLLVFFLLIGRMDATAPFDVVPPRSGAGEDLPGGGITVAISAEGMLALDGAPRTEAELLTDLEARLATTPALLVRINAHRAAPLRLVLPLTSRIEAAGARDIVLVVTPEAE